MRDALEEQLARRLETLGETVGDELTPPADLELQVVRRRRRTRSTRRWSGVAAAAAVVFAVTAVAAMHGSSGHGAIQVESSSTTAAASAPVADSLQPGTVMLSSFGRWVVSLDALGRQTATMVTVDMGSEVKYARATDDHRQIWYLSSKNGKATCGDVVRADIDQGNSSTIVSHAVAFDISPDGSRLALYGAGDLARGQCVPVKPGAQGRIVVMDLVNGSTSAANVGNSASMRWSDDGSYLANIDCQSGRCGDLSILSSAPGTVGGPLSASPAAVSPDPTGLARVATIAMGTDGVYLLESTEVSTRVERVVPWGVDHAPTIVFDGGTRWKVTQVVPTSAATYVVAEPLTMSKAKARIVGHAGLYRVAAGKLAFVRSLAGPGTLTPVTPLPPGG